MLKFVNFRFFMSDSFFSVSVDIGVVLLEVGDYLNKSAVDEYIFDLSIWGASG